MSANTTFARPYAKAAFEFALEKKTIAEWDEFLQAAAALVKNKDVAMLIANPEVSSKQVEELLIELCERQLGNKKLNEQQLNFIHLLSQNDRVIFLAEIAELFTKQRVEHEKKLVVKITSAFPIGPEQQKRFAQALKIRMQREVSVDIDSDIQLIGGAIIRAGDFVIDGSVKSQLDKMMQTLID